VLCGEGLTPEGFTQHDGTVREMESGKSYVIQVEASGPIEPGAYLQAGPTGGRVMPHSTSGAIDIDILAWDRATAAGQLVWCHVLNAARWLRPFGRAHGMAPYRICGWTGGSEDLPRYAQPGDEVAFWIVAPRIGYADRIEHGRIYLVECTGPVAKGDFLKIGVNGRAQVHTSGFPWTSPDERPWFRAMKASSALGHLTWAKCIHRWMPDRTTPDEFDDWDKGWPGPIYGTP
jgi:hypothetical protein